ncbi:MAG: hypothetical protein II919_08925 [Lachnospiraceae bacterium]|nr:hypothetical protein [Lachnospiraceae bacterium]
MSGLILCTKKSDIPYKITDSNTNIYSIEELAYYLYNNAYFVDDSFFTWELIDYIEKKLKLKKIAEKLKFAMKQKMDFTEKVMIVITGSMYYTESEMKALEKELKSISSKSMLERMNARAKMLYDNNKLLGAKLVYENILAGLNQPKQERPEKSFYADVHYGMAKILCRMFYFKEALEEFQLAYQLDDADHILKAIVNTKLMMKKTETAEIDLSKEREIDKSLVDECELDFRDLVRNIKLSGEYERLERIFTYDGRRNLDEYYDNMQSVLGVWKEEYRSEIS